MTNISLPVILFLTSPIKIISLIKTGTVGRAGPTTHSAVIYTTSTQTTPDNGHQNESPPPHQKQDNIVAIGGAVAGSGVLVIVIVITVVCIMKCRKSSTPKIQPGSERPENHYVMSVINDGYVNTPTATHGTVNLAVQNEPDDTVGTASVTIEMNGNNRSSEHLNENHNKADETVDVDSLYAKPVKKKNIKGEPGQDNCHDDNNQDIRDTEEKLNEDENVVSMNNAEGLTYAELDLSSMEPRRSTKKQVKQEEETVNADLKT
ncbi:uncharacterized protein LOC144433068 [Glandiceps talaboti]